MSNLTYMNDVHRYFFFFFFLFFCCCSCHKTLAFNVIPHVDVFQKNGYTKEEMKVVWETRKIFNVPELLCSCTAVRVPTLRAHAESIVIETSHDIGESFFVQFGC